jgi:hypothetical protein
MTKMSKADLNKTLKSLLRYGIAMGTTDQEDDDNYLIDLSLFINESHSHNALHEPSKNRILIETVYFNPICYVEITRGTLSFIPITDEGFFPVMMKVLEHIAHKEREEEALRIKKKREESVPDDIFDWV